MGEKNRYTADIKRYTCAEEFLFDYAEEADFDILLLDIQMGKMSGVELARMLRRDNEAIQIVFITGYSDYISEGYEVAALHYLMKPIKEDKLADTLTRADRALKKTRGLFLSSFPERHFEFRCMK